MKNKLLIAILIIVALVILIVAGYVFLNKKKNTSVDNLSESLLKDLTAESSLIESDSGDDKIIEEDSQLITNFGQSYENQF